MRFLPSLSLIPSLITLLSSVSVSAQSTNATNATLPVVDLGYELHQASFLNETGKFYNFSNIPYAASPLGDLRFRAPQPPVTNRSTVDTGSIGRICPQSYPAWIIEGEFFVSNYSQGLPFNVSVWDAEAPNITVDTFPVDGRSTEDCLVLDVVVPQTVLESAGSGSGAPVIVWLHGGGFAVGSKDFYGSGAGIVTHSETTASNGTIWVAINYRLGALGFLSGSTLEADGTANAGLLDQRMALDWVQEHVSKFGGDPNQVTVLGESAGAGSIVYHLTSYGGNNGSAPFQRAIPQSPAFTPFTSTDEQEAVFQEFLASANVSTLAELRNLSSEALIRANLQATLDAPYGSFPYTPVVDGSYVPDLPQLMLLHGQYDTSVEVLVSHNSDEGALFTNPAATTDAGFDSFVRANFPNITDDAVAYIENTLYPPSFNGTEPYTNNLDRAVLLQSEVTIVCNTFYLDKAFNNQTYAYIFAVPPGLHGNDVPFTFYNGPYGDSYNSASFNSTVAQVMQDYITTFAATGIPTTSVEGVPELGTYGSDASAMELTSTGIYLVADPAANSRCDWWQQVLYT